MPSPNALPIPVREAAGRTLWARLLDDPPRDPEPDVPDPEPDENDGDPERDAA